MSFFIAALKFGLMLQNVLPREHKRRVRVHEAPQASHDKRTRPPGWHRNCFQTNPRKRATIICMHFQKSKHFLGSEVS